MHGATVTESGPFSVEIELMREFGWTWHDLQSTPADVIDIAIERIAAERYWHAEKAKLQKAMSK